MPTVSAPEKAPDFGVVFFFEAGREYRPYFENYTVDASILDRCVLGLGLCADITNKDLVVVEITSVVC